MGGRRQRAYLSNPSACVNVCVCVCVCECVHMDAFLLTNPDTCTCTHTYVHDYHTCIHTYTHTYTHTHTATLRLWFHAMHITLPFTAIQTAGSLPNLHRYTMPSRQPTNTVQLSCHTRQRTEALTWSKEKPQTKNITQKALDRNCND